MKLKNALIYGVSLVLVAALAIGGTVAFLTSEDEDINVMTLGNVTIKQNEYQRVVNDDGTYATDTIDGRNSYVLEDFTQNKPLLPIVGDPSLPNTDPGYKGYDATGVRMTQVGSYGTMEVFDGKNAQDKFVTVTNTGKNDAYVRTFVAVEIGSGNYDYVGTSYHNTWKKNEVGAIKIDGENYYLYEYIYLGGELSDGSWRHEGGLLPAGDTSYPSLSQVYINSCVTNEDLEALDGDNDGLLDIRVFSQAVQADGFENSAAAFKAAFGETSVDNHPWAD